jgi:hypothetical protein
LSIPVTFKDGETGTARIELDYFIPIDILIRAKDQVSQHFTINLELHNAQQMPALVDGWLARMFAPTRGPKSISAKMRAWLRLIFGFRRCFLVAPLYKESTHGKKSQQVNVLEGPSESQRYGVCYLWSLVTFYREFKRKRLTR